jgi:hypothetical protein
MFEKSSIPVTVQARPNQPWSVPDQRWFGVVGLASRDGELGNLIAVVPRRAAGHGVARGVLDVQVEVDGQTGAEQRDAEDRERLTSESQASATLTLGYNMVAGTLIR